MLELILISLGILSGGAAAKSFGLLSPTSNTWLPVKMPTDKILKFLKKSEGLMVNSYYASAYEKSKNIVTIGYGTTAYFDSNGKSFLYNGSSNVKIGQNLNLVKQAYKFTGTLEQFASQLILNYIKSSRYSKVSNDLQKLSVPFNQNLSDALVDATYNSGSIFGGIIGDGFYTFFLNDIKNAKSSRDLAIAYFKYRYLYVKNFAKGNFPANQHGWLIRYYSVAKYIETGQFLTLNASNGLSKNLDTVFKDYGIRFIS